MYINRALLAAIGILLVFSPAIEGWLFSGDAPWYRPYQLWLVIIVAAWWNSRSRQPDEL